MLAALLRVLECLALVGLYGFSLLGWGRLVTGASGRREAPLAVQAGLGLAAIVVLGGVLNLARIAVPPVLDAVVIAGWALAAWRIREAIRSGTLRLPPRRAWPSMALPWLAVLAAVAFLSLTVAVPRAYNFHDDYLTYFVHPVRMLATGTVHGSPVSVIGRLFVGGQAFLDGFLLAHLPIAYLNSVDALFCLALLLVVLVAFATRSGPAPVPALLAVVLAVAINPQFVNVSAHWSGSVLAAVLFLLCTASPADAAEVRAGGVRRLLPPALVAAALVALKPTFLPFAALQLAALAAADGIERRSLRRAAASGGWLLALASAFFAPWLAVHAESWLAVNHGGSDDVGTPTFLPVNPFDVTPLQYGDTVVHFSLAAAIPLAAGLGFAAAWRRSVPGSSRAVRMAAACLGAAATYAAFLLVPWIAHAPPERMIRFYCPIAIASTPATFLVAWDHLPGLLTGVASRAVRPALAAWALVVATAFAPGAWDRAAQALEEGSMLAFAAARSASYLEYNRRVLDGDYASSTARMQSVVPPGERLLAWVATPFYLDFARNSVLDVDMAGLANPWASTPPVRWVLWSYRGPAVRSIAACASVEGTRRDLIAGARCAELQMGLAAMVSSGGAEVLADDGEMALLRMRAPVELRNGALAFGPADPQTAR